jgi:hypothetical protein
MGIRIVPYPIGHLGRGGLSVVGGASSILPFTDAFGRADGALGNGWTGATWTISGNKVINTPTLTGNLITNGNMETGDPPTGWTVTSNAVLDGVADERTGGAGSQSLSVVNGAVSVGAARQSMTHAAHTWIRLSGWLKLVTGTTCSLRLLTSGFGDVCVMSRPETSWTQWIGAGRVTTTNGIVASYNGQSSLGNEHRSDDIEAYPLTLSHLFATIPATKSDVTCGVLATLDTYMQGGVVVNLDSAASPANFVIGYYNRATGKALLERCVAGTYDATPLINITKTYVAGAEVKVIKSGTTYQLYYNGAQVGTDQTISDAGIISNTIHGMFTTGGAATSLDAFFCQ